MTRGREFRVRWGYDVAGPPIDYDRPWDELVNQGSRNAPLTEPEHGHAVVSRGGDFYPQGFEHRQPRPRKEEPMSRDWTIGKPSGGGGGGNFKSVEHEDHLLAFVGITFQPAVHTVHGEADAAAVETVVDLDDGTIITDAMIFGAALVPRLTGGEEDIVVGRLVKGEQSKPGQNPPWLLEDPDDNDMKSAEDFFDTHATKLRSGRIIIEAEPPEKF